jgi:exoribonuclease R
VVFHVRVAADGSPTLDGATRAVVRSRAKLAYDAVTPADLPAGFDELSQRIEAAAAARGATAVEPPEQVVARDDGHYRLEFRPRLESESQNAAMSLASNLAVAATMLVAKVGLFRVMAPPSDRAVRRLRHTARSLGLHWPEEQPLDKFVRGLDPNSARQAAFMMAVRRAGGGASYMTASDDVTPWHAAMAATYAHATAPLRRLADRYTVMTAFALASGAEVDERTRAALERLPDEMAHAETRAGNVDRAVLDLAEAVMLHGREGEVFDAIVVDDDDEISRVHLSEVAVVVNLRLHRVQPGDSVQVRLVSADPARREVRFERVG